MNYWLVDSKKAEGEPAPALTDEEEMLKYWKISKIQNKNNFCFCIRR